MERMVLKSSADKTGIILWVEVTIRVVLFLIFWITEMLHPFHRKIHIEELWLYKNPRTDSYVPVAILWPLVISVPLFFITLFGVIKRDKSDILPATLALTLTLGLNGMFTNVTKLIVGRPRPDFFWRCFPDGFFNSEMNCTGNILDVSDGFKSFPSGHSSFSFASMGFTSLYLAGKLYCFNIKGRGQSWRLCFAFFPLVVALMVALSRTADYHHHWQDVLCGSLLGLGIAYVCYYQYYPSLHNLHSERSFASLSLLLPRHRAEFERSEELISVKWI